MRKKLFLTGIISLGLIFALALSGCKSDDDSSSGGGNNNGSGGGNSLVGTWVDDPDDLDNINTAIIFTNTTPPASANVKLAYYAKNLVSDGNHTLVGSTDRIAIGPNQKTYDVVANSKTADQFTLKGYIAAVAVTNPDGNVIFNRAVGTNTAGNGSFRGIWISELAPTDNTYTILLIGDTSGEKVWYSKGGDVAEANYRTSEDIANNSLLISWNGGQSATYTYNANTTVLRIPPPGGGNPVTLKSLYTSPNF